MVNPTFVLSVFAVKGGEERRRVDYRQTNMRYVVVLIAIFVVFGCEYCFDNASVPLPCFRPCRSSSKATSEKTTNLSTSSNSISFTPSTPSPT